MLLTLTETDDPTLTSSSRPDWPAVQWLVKEPGVELLPSAVFFFILDTIISVTFHVNNRAQRYECLSGETD